MTRYALPFCALPLFTTGCDPDKVPEPSEDVVFTDGGGGPAADSCFATTVMNHDGFTIVGVQIRAGEFIPDGVFADLIADSGAHLKTNAGIAFEPVTAGGSSAGPNPWFYDAPELECGSPSCGTGEWRVFWDPFGAAPASAGLCDTYVPVTLDITRASVSTASLVPSESSCVAGSSTFQLIPVRFIDRDGDDEGRVIYKPAKVDGTGRMTNAARITSIDLVDNAGYNLRVIKAGAEMTYALDDSIIDPSANSYAVTGNHNFSTGQVSGVPVFVHAPMTRGTLIDAQVDIAWDCGGSPTPVTLPQGYSFRSDDIGCPGETHLTVRPGNGRLTWELYGDSTYSHDIPVSPLGEFQLNWAGVEVEGTIVSQTSTELTVELESASLGLFSQCTPDTYIFAAEQ